MMPSCAISERAGTTAAGSRNEAASGYARPRTDGPRMMPANTPPMTAGCPIRRSTGASNRPTRMIAASAARMCSSGLVPIADSPDLYRRRRRGPALLHLRPHHVDVREDFADVVVEEVADQQVSQVALE